MKGNLSKLLSHRPNCSSFVGNTPVLFYGKHTYLSNHSFSVLVHCYVIILLFFFFKHRCYHSLSCTKDDLNIQIITLALMKTSLAEDTTWSSCKKNNVFIAFCIFSCRGFGSIFLLFQSPCSLLLPYSPCTLYTVFPYNESIEQNTKLGISTYTIAV